MIAIIIFTILAFLASERIWFVVLGANMNAGAIALLALIAIVANSVLFLRTRRTNLTLKGRDTWSSSSHELEKAIFTDAVGLAVVWFLLWIVTGAINFRVDANQSILFWSHISGRTLGFIRPILLIALLFWSFNWLTRASGKRFAPVATALVILVSSGLSVSAWQRGSPQFVLERNTEMLRSLDARTSIQKTRLEPDDEALIYYALARSLLQGKSTFGFLPKSPASSAAPTDKSPGSR